MAVFGSKAKQRTEFLAESLDHPIHRAIGKLVTLGEQGAEWSDSPQQVETRPGDLEKPRLVVIQSR